MEQKFCVTSTWNTCWKQNFVQSMTCLSWEILRNKQPISMSYWTIQATSVLFTWASIFTSRLIHTGSMKNKQNIVWLCISQKFLCSALIGTVGRLENKWQMLQGTQNIKAPSKLNIIQNRISVLPQPSGRLCHVC